LSDPVQSDLNLEPIRFFDFKHEYPVHNFLSKPSRVQWTLITVSYLKPIDLSIFLNKIYFDHKIEKFHKTKRSFGRYF